MRAINSFTIVVARAMERSTISILDELRALLLCLNFESLSSVHKCFYRL